MPNHTESLLSYHGPVMVFDLDDTLYAEFDWAVSGYRAVGKWLEEHYKSLDTDEIVRAMEDTLTRHGNPFDTLEALLSRAGIDEPIAKLLDIYRYHTPSITLYQDVKETLDELRRHGIRMGLITDGRSRTQRLKIKALGLEPYFHPADILISEEVGADKTSSEPFRRIVHHYPEASSYIYIGDNPVKDIETPLLLGWEVWIRKAAPCNIHPQDLSATLPPHRIINDFSEIKPKS